MFTKVCSKAINILLTVLEDRLDYLYFNATKVKISRNDILYFDTSIIEIFDDKYFYIKKNHLFNQYCKKDRDLRKIGDDWFYNLNFLIQII